MAYPLPAEQLVAAASQSQASMGPAAAVRTSAAVAARGRCSLVLLPLDRARRPVENQAMALIVQAGDPVLRQPALPVASDRLGTPGLLALVAEMVETMRAAPGVGLAAPQIGVPLQLIVVEDPGERGSDRTSEEHHDELAAPRADPRERTPLPLTAIVNPQLRLVGSERAVFFEGCLSVKGFSALVPRALEVEVEGLTPEGAPLRLQLHGWPARILQHEVDHLRGTLYVDRMLSRSFAQTESVQRRWGQKTTAEVAAALGVDLTPTG